MAFKLRNLFVLAYAGGFTQWHYKLDGDKLNQAQEIGYFADAADLIAKGDMLIVSGAEGGGIFFMRGVGKQMQLVPAVTP